MTSVRGLEGTLFQGWQLHSVLGEGADGIVYVGSKAGQERAIKLFFPDVLAKNGLEQERERLDTQLSLKGKKHHTSLVEVFDGGFDDSLQTLFLIMERALGNSLDKCVGKLPRQAIPSLLQQMASAARYLEENGLAHRDIKPANIVISDDFKTLTLLDFGVVFRLPTDAADKELSGDEFVASLRYSPPEFVWRQEERSDAEALRAITFYQIGATLHDMLTGAPLFFGFDKPRACLYDAVRLRPPVIEAPDCHPWLAEIAKRCLVKNWRERLQLVNWESFEGLPQPQHALTERVHALRLRQIRSDELKNLEEAQQMQSNQPARAVELWNLHDRLFLEIRQFLMNAQIFPRFSATHAPVSDKHYVLQYDFEEDSLHQFPKPVAVTIALQSFSDSEVSIKLHLSARMDGQELLQAEWIEMLTVDSALALCQGAFCELVDLIVPKA